MDPASIAVVVVASIGAVGFRMLADWLGDNDEDDTDEEKEALRAKVSELALKLEQERNERRERDRSLLGEAPREHVPSSETGDAIDPWGTPDGADPTAPAAPVKPHNWWNDPQPPIQSIGGPDALQEALEAQRVAIRKAALAEEELRVLRKQFEDAKGKSPRLYVVPRTEMIETYDGRSFPVVVGETLSTNPPGSASLSGRRRRPPVVDHGAGLPPMSQPLKRPYLRTSPDMKGAKGKRKHQITFDLPAGEAIDDRPDQVAVELCASAGRTMNRTLLPGSIVRESMVSSDGRLRYTYGFYTMPKNW